MLSNSADDCHLKSLNDAETIRAKILGAFELAATTDDEAERARHMTFVLVGAGPTGVELAGSLADLVKVTLRGNFHRIDPAKSAIILLDASKRVLPTFAESVSRKVTRRLEKSGAARLCHLLTGSSSKRPRSSRVHGCLARVGAADAGRTRRGFGYSRPLLAAKLRGEMLVVRMGHRFCADLAHLVDGRA